MPEKPFTPAEERRGRTGAPPPAESRYPDLAARYGGPADDDLEDVEREAERVLEQWPARHQGNLTGAIDHVLARRNRTTKGPTA